MDQYSLANSFLSSYTGIPPEMFSMGPDLLSYSKNKDRKRNFNTTGEVIGGANKSGDLKKTGKNKYNIFDSPTSFFNEGYFSLPSSGFDTTGIIKDIMDGKKEDEKEKKDEEYGRMTEYAKSVIGEVDKVAQKARAADFLREGIRSLANAPLLGAEYAMRAAEGINNVTIANMGAMAAQNRVLESNPTKQKIAGRYFG
tara:strand:- start:19 stop:612 length:594 start_codon:yes stop_codon:yes gene_type:complete